MQIKTLSSLPSLSLILALWSGAITQATGESPAAKKEWESLFDGKSLQGWQVKHITPQSTEAEKTPPFWSVSDGAILAKTPDSSHAFSWLVSDKEYANFELKLKIQSFKNATGNSGIQVRSRYVPTTGEVNGPQVDIHPKAPWRTGFLWEQTQTQKGWLSPLEGKPADAKETHAPEDWKWTHADEAEPSTAGAWNEIHIICNGTTITTKVNGVQVVNYDGAGVLDDDNHKKHNIGLKGHIMLQLHKKQTMHLRFKDIYIKQL